MHMFVTLSQPNRSTKKHQILGGGTPEYGQGFRLPDIGIDHCFEATKAQSRYKVYVYWDVESGSASAGPQVKGNHNEADNSTAFQCPPRPETTARKSSPSRAAPGSPPIPRTPGILLSHPWVCLFTQRIFIKTIICFCNR